MCPRRLLRRIAPFAALAVAVSLPAQVQWQRFEYLPRTTGPLVYDSARDRFLLLTDPNGIGTPETWERDRNAGWLPRQVPNSPPRREGHAMAFDSVRGETVLFSAESYITSSSADTYTWNGATWSNVSPAVQPAARSGFAMTFDVARGRVVMFGGFSPLHLGGYNYYADTWEWNGTVWAQQSMTGPTARGAHALVYDPARANVVLFGGMDSQGALGDTWTYAAGGWTPRGTGPGPRRDAAMGYDVARSRAVLFGGSPASNTYVDDTWEWDGAAWSATQPTARPSPRARAGFASDPVGGGVLLVGGRDAAAALADTWRWDGNAWTLVEDASQPSPRHSHATAFDETHGELLVFGGIGNALLGDLWRWNGTQWNGAAPAGPSARDRAAMAFDALRGEAVMFGGSFTNETWTWNGTLWSQRAPTVSPSPRDLHAMAYDRQRARVVLFGGFQNVYNNNYLGDTWEWDGTAWLQRTGPAPLPRHGHAMAYDAARGVTVLYGGVGAGLPWVGTALTDTWEWNGALWTRRLPANDPGPRREFGLTFDTARARVVGSSDSGSQDAFEWDGTNWSLRVVPAAPPSRIRTSIVFDTVREHALLFGGQSSSANYADLWRYGPVVAAAVIPFGTACAGSLGLPQIAASSRPWLGDPVHVALGNGPNSAPAAIWLGLSKTIYGAFALPLLLAPFGMPGCSLWSSIDASVLTVASPAGVATLALTVPNLPGLLGVEIHGQGGFFDPPANTAGIATSAALTLRVGGR